MCVEHHNRRDKDKYMCGDVIDLVLSHSTNYGQMNARCIWTVPVHHALAPASRQLSRRMTLALEMSYTNIHTYIQKERRRQPHRASSGKTIVLYSEIRHRSTPNSSFSKVP